MSDEKRCCTAVSELGFNCTREEGHDGPSDNSPLKYAGNPKHVARNADNMVVQIWHEHPDEEEVGSRLVLKAGR